MEENFDKNNENCIEWLTGSHTVTATYTDRKYINRISKLYEERPNEFELFIKNTDGSVCAKFPKKWVKNNPGSIPDPDRPKRTRTPEQIEAATKALEEWRRKNKSGQR